MERNKIFIDTETRKPIGDLFGIFFEDLNHAADGGLYAELVQNRSFEFQKIDNPSYHALTAWEPVGGEGKVILTVREGGAVNERNPHYLQITVADDVRNAGVKNTGFGRGMYLEAGKKYLFSCYARCMEETDCKMEISLQSEEDAAIAEESFTVGGTWKKYELVLTPKETTKEGCLALIITEGNNVDIDFVSLFPKETYKGRKNGMRADLVKVLKELEPRFMRFPGGCLVHDGSLDENARDSLYRWKNTIGPLEQRPARRSNWGYNQTLGLGYYEYFVLCEDIGAKPVPILPAAYDPHHKRSVPLDELEPWIQETLDLIEFANGDLTTKWGKIRAELGHEKPFHLEYLGIGNEEVGEGFRERLPYFVKAVRQKYPEIKIIGSSGPFCAGMEYESGWECARENGADLVDEHYYMAPEWFIANMHRYDSFKEGSPHVFLGEYASWSNTGESALVEAAFMTQLQNASHAVKMACYAPLLCHKEYVNWKPDMIWFDNANVCKTVNYEVQKLFMNHQGDELLSYRFQTPPHKKTLVDLQTRKQGDIYFWGNDARILFSDIVLYDEETQEEISFSDIEVCTDKIPVLLTKNAPQNFRLRFHAKELEGFKGFRLYFSWKDEKNKMSWELGGWQNQDGALTEETGGRNSVLTQRAFEVVQGRDYELELRVSGNRIEGWIDGELFQSATLLPVDVEPLYITASREQSSSDLIIKAVNLREDSIETEIVFTKLDGVRYLCDIYELLEKDCVESVDFPGVQTVEVKNDKKLFEFENENKALKWIFPARCVTVLRFKKLESDS